MPDNNLQSERVADESTSEVSNIVTLTIDERQYQIFLPNASTDYIQKKISTEKQPYELSMLQDIQRRVEPNDLVLDIGANR